MIELPEDIAEDLANKLNIYGTASNDDNYQEDHKDNCGCRICFVIEMTERIRRAVHNEDAFNKGAKL